METVTNALSDGAATIQAVRKSLATLDGQKNDFLHRIASPPSAPSPSPTSSYWLDDPPFPSLCDRQDELRPDDSPADLVIIGSGITAASAAKTALELNPDLDVLVFEARELCGGATGRNGGHVKAEPYVAFAKLKTMLGPERAAQLTRLQMRHVDLLGEVGEAMPGAEVRDVETVDYYLEEEAWKLAKGMVADVKEFVEEVEIRVWEAEEARAKVSGGRVGSPLLLYVCAC